MSPLQIRIMLHYYTNPEAWDGSSAVTWDCVDELAGNGMLKINTTKPIVEITDKGSAYVNKLCSIPIPVETTTYTFPVEDEE